MAHADIDPTCPPRRRIGAVVLIQDTTGRILLVQPRYKDGAWQLPGGGAHEGEHIADAAARELAEETGLHLRISHFLAVDHVPANPDTGAAEGFNFICDGGTLTGPDADTATIPDTARHELTELRWVPLGQLGEHTRPYQERRIRAALLAHHRSEAQPLLVHGNPVA